MRLLGEIDGEEDIARGDLWKQVGLFIFIPPNFLYNKVLESHLQIFSVFRILFQVVKIDSILASNLMDHDLRVA